MTAPIVEVSRSFEFEAAHRLPNVPDSHKCGRLHGHSYRVRVTLRGPVDVTEGWLVDFADIDVACKSVRAQLDHRLLNDIIGLENPTSEVLAVWIYANLVETLAQVYEVEVRESRKSRVVYRGT